MKLARYMGGGIVEIVDEALPDCLPGGLLVRTEACGLCSGELMSWYMDRKVPHVLGHEVAGIVVESQDELYQPGDRVFAHHHASCLRCDYCLKGHYVNCEQWKRTKLTPGGMAEYFAVSAENLTETYRVPDMRAIDAALIEPVACVYKSIDSAAMDLNARAAVIGLGVMGLIHCLLLPNAIGIDVNPDRVKWARNLGLNAILPTELSSEDKFDRIFVCPGSQVAFDDALEISNPDARIVMFAPLPPDECLQVPQAAYFNGIEIKNSYSCGPIDSRQAEACVSAGRIKAEQVVSDFIGIDQLPEAYGKMRRGEILKPMVIFPAK